MVEPSLEWFAPIKDDFSIDRKFLKLPTLYLGKIREKSRAAATNLLGVQKTGHGPHETDQNDGFAGGW